MVVFEQIGCIRAKWLYWGKVVVFGKKLLYSGKSGCIRENWLYLVKKWLYLCKSGCICTRLILFWKDGCIRAKGAVIG